MPLTEFQTYLADAHERVAETRAAGLLETARRHDGEIARALAILTRSYDRRHGLTAPAPSHREPVRFVDMSEAA